MSNGDGDNDSLGGTGDDDVDMGEFFGKDEMESQDEGTDMDWPCGTRSRLHQKGLFQVDDR
jgi:hypothetical protein